MINIRKREEETIPIIGTLCHSTCRDRDISYVNIKASNPFGNDSSMGQWMYLTACPLHDPGHDSPMKEWMYLTVCPPLGPGSAPVRGILRDFTLADHTLPTRPGRAWPEMVQSPLDGTTQPVDIEEEGHCLSVVGRVHDPMRETYE